MKFNLFYTNNKLIFQGGLEAVMSVYDTICSLFKYKTKKYRFKCHSTYDTIKITIYPYRKFTKNKNHESIFYE